MDLKQVRGRIRQSVANASTTTARTAITGSRALAGALRAQFVSIRLFWMGLGADEPIARNLAWPTFIFLSACLLLGIVVVSIGTGCASTFLFLWTKNGFGRPPILPAVCYFSTGRSYADHARHRMPNALPSTIRLQFLTADCESMHKTIGRYDHDVAIIILTTSRSEAKPLSDTLKLLKQRQEDLVVASEIFHEHAANSVSDSSVAVFNWYVTYHRDESKDLEKSRIALSILLGEIRAGTTSIVEDANNLAAETDTYLTYWRTWRRAGRSADAKLQRDAHALMTGGRGGILLYLTSKHSRDKKAAEIHERNAALNSIWVTGSAHVARLEQIHHDALSYARSMAEFGDLLSHQLNRLLNEPPSMVTWALMPRVVLDRIENLDVRRPGAEAQYAEGLDAVVGKMRI